MKPEDMTPEQLDEAACRAVGIAPLGWRAGKIRVYANWDETLEETRARMGDFGEGAVEFNLKVSQKPAASALLKVAMIDAGLPPLLIFWGEPRVLAMLCDAVGEHPEEAAWELSATAGTWSRAKTEERATALAVVAWKQTKPNN